MPSWRRWRDLGPGGAGKMSGKYLIASMQDFAAFTTPLSNNLRNVGTVKEVVSNSEGYKVVDGVFFS